ncbi:hypothetical protein DENIS_0995 [Desulfonema ishimotonii]|uniref:O-methyltransferase n=2 Tax=Desulfonema ishimotonii TaxID=45657 RepID=A0A401FSX5_9BACT|nr:hypothetical protein DENIS_0995 [Desulfonema ishimotonii]
MIENPEAYFRERVPRSDPLLRDMEAAAREDGIPIIGPLMGQLLCLLVRATGAKRILELGTATGYSALWLARGCAETGGEVVTLEHSPGLAKRALSNFRKSGLGRHITLVEGKASDTMADMTGPFDFIFMDIDKEYYRAALAPSARLLRRNGLLVADNTAFKDSDDFNRAVADHPMWEAVNLFAFLPFHSPEKDGLCFALRA